LGPIFKRPPLKRHGQTTLASRYVIISDLQTPTDLSTFQHRCPVT
jgi:hypothetical protein